MRIGVNTLSISPGRTGGGETYLINLLKNITEIDTDSIYYLFVNSENHHIFPDTENIRKVFCKAWKNPKAVRIFWEQFVLPWQTKLSRIDILFSPANISPVFILPCKSVLTLHDLNWAYFGEYLPRSESTLLKYLITKSTRKADKIIAVSESTKRDAVSFAGVSEDKIAIVYEGTDDSFTRIQNNDRDSLKNRLNIDSAFILSVGTTHQHKNFIRLLDAFVLLKRKGGFSEYKLVFAGMPGRAHLQVIEKVKELGLLDSIVITEAVTKEELIALYHGADLFVFPSLYEGFGLPVLEAMSCGTAVVASNRASIPEVGGDAVLYFDPLDIYEMAEKMAIVLKDRELRRSLKAKGLERANLFSWEKAASETLKVFEEVYCS